MSSVAAPERRREPFVVLLIGLGSLAAITAAVAVGAPVEQLAPLMAVAALGAALHRVLTRWDSLLVALIAVIMLIPIRRYTMPGDLPFELEPYRLLVAGRATAGLSALVLDGRGRLRRH